MVSAFQLLGRTYSDGAGRVIPGLGLLDVDTAAGSPRLVGEVVTRTREGELLTGFENHGGRTLLGSEVEPLGTVVRGNGNNGEDATEGARHGSLLGTYLHGPVLAKSPRFADELLRRALVRRGADADLEPLDDALPELAAAVALSRPR